MHRVRSNRGYTVIELLIITIIITVLAAIAMFRMFNAPQRAIAATLQSDLRGLIAAQEVHRSDHGTYATGLDQLAESYRTSQGVELTLTASGQAWTAEATHPAAPLVCRASGSDSDTQAPTCDVSDS